MSKKEIAKIQFIAGKVEMPKFRAAWDMVFKWADEGNLLLLGEPLLSNLAKIPVITVLLKKYVSEMTY